MSLSIIPKARPGVSESEMTWNELFYLCLQKNIWIIVAGVIFVALVLFAVVIGKLTDVMDVIVILIMSVGITYIPIAFPISIVFASVKRMKQKQ